MHTSVHIGTVCVCHCVGYIHAGTPLAATADSISGGNASHLIVNIYLLLIACKENNITRGCCGFHLKWNTCRNRLFAQGRVCLAAMAKGPYKLLIAHLLGLPAIYIQLACIGLVTYFVCSLWK